MTRRVATVAFSGIEAKRVDVEVQLVGGVPGFPVVGLADKACSESRERVRAAFASLGLALPADRIVANLAPADLPKGQPKSPRASPRRARAPRQAACRRTRSTARPMAICSIKSRGPMRRAPRSWPRRRGNWRSQRAAITARCGSRARSPIWKGRAGSNVCTLARRLASGAPGRKRLPRVRRREFLNGA